MKEDVIGPVPARFGLLDASPGRWKNLDEKLDFLEQEFPDAKIKVIWAGRHGQVLGSQRLVLYHLIIIFLGMA